MPIFEDLLNVFLVFFVCLVSAPFLSKFLVLAFQKRETPDALDSLLKRLSIDQWH